jgi:DNA methyltransferase 1-associated protein 1
MNGQKIIEIAGGMPPVMPSVDFRQQSISKPRKWEYKLGTHGFYSWTRVGDDPRPIPPKETVLIQYSDKEYDELLKNPNWTKEETDHLMNLCAEYHLKFFIVYDRYEMNPRPIEELKQRYYQVNRILLSKRNGHQKDIISNYAFDLVRENARKANLELLMSRTPQQIQANQTNQGGRSPVS